MGSQSDFKTMILCQKVLKSLDVKYETKIISAHRTPDRMYKYAKNAENDNITSIPEISMEELVFIDPVMPEVELVEEKIELEKVEKSLIPLMPKRMTFGQAFAMARTEFGSGSLFTWNGTTYTTSYAEELTKDNILQPDSGNVNIVLNTTLKGKKGEE